MTLVAAAVAALAAGIVVFWRYVWFFRDPQRIVPDSTGILSPADGTVVYVQRVPPGADVVVIKRGVAATVRDLVREDSAGEKLVIGIFMSPFDVHFNRAPLTGRIDFIRHYPAAVRNRFMTAMHLRVLLRLRPFYRGSIHVIENERTVTRFEGWYAGAALAAYVVQIGARTVNGIDAYCAAGDVVTRGTTFGMIRIGSQVDLVLPWRESFLVQVAPGDVVRAGQSVLLT